MTRRWASALSLAAALAAGSGSARAAAADGSLCLAAIAAVEPTARLPKQMLSAIGVVESARPDSRTGTPVPWPWTVNVGGVGHLYDSAAEAIAAVRAAQAGGAQSIDVGCMQINLLYHPDAFASLEQAFDPLANVRYAAAFLQRLHAATGSWSATVADYHSSMPVIGAAYLGRVAGVWQLSPLYGVVAPPIPVAPASAAGAARPREEPVDPYRVLTPAFRAQLVGDAAFRRERDAALGLVPPPAAALRGAAYPTRRGPRRARLMEASLHP